MNKLKRTLALVATLAISATAFVGCGDSSSSSSSSSSEESSSSESSQILNLLLKVKAQLLNRANLHIQVHFQQAADKMTILCWTPDDVNVMLDMWKADTG